MPLLSCAQMILQLGIIVLEVLPVSISISSLYFNGAAVESVTHTYSYLNASLGSQHFYYPLITFALSCLSLAGLILLERRAWFQHRKFYVLQFILYGVILAGVVLCSVYSTVTYISIALIALILLAIVLHSVRFAHTKFN